MKLPQLLGGAAALGLHAVRKTAAQADGHTIAVNPGVGGDSYYGAVQ